MFGNNNGRIGIFRILNLRFLLEIVRESKILQKKNSENPVILKILIKEYEKNYPNAWLTCQRKINLCEAISC